MDAAVARLQEMAHDDWRWSSGSPLWLRILRYAVTAAAALVLAAAGGLAAWIIDQRRDWTRSA